MTHKTILLAGYPKSGNTLLGESLLLAGKEYCPDWDLGEYKTLNDLFDSYCLSDNNIKAKLNPLFNSFCIKTHNKISRYVDLKNSFYGGVSHVITITRNPFEILLSSLNYFRYLKKNNNFTDVTKKSINLLIPDYKINQETFLEDFTLEKLRENDFLNQALTNFSNNGTSILEFFEMSGTWCSYTTSFHNHHDIKNGENKLKLLNIKYEDMVNDCEKCSEQIANFLEIDKKYIVKGFDKQKKLAE